MSRRRLRLSPTSDDEEQQVQMQIEEAQLQPTVNHQSTVPTPLSNPNSVHFQALEISDDDDFIDVAENFIDVPDDFFDVDDNLSPPSPPAVTTEQSFQTPPFVGSGLACPIGDSLQRLGLRLRREWLDSCIRGLEGSVAGFERLHVAGKAKLCFEQFLYSDMNYSGGGVLPDNVSAMHLVDLAGPFVLQVDEIVNISCPLRGRYSDAPPGIKRCLKLSMTDGVQRVFGMEYRPIKALEVMAPAGLKVAICNVNVRRGLLMLVPEVIEVLGGLVEELDAARQRLVHEVNKPPRGNRTRTGVVPSLATRATLAAWPPNGVTGLEQPINGSTTQNSTNFQANDVGSPLAPSGIDTRGGTMEAPNPRERTMEVPGPRERTMEVPNPRERTMETSNMRGRTVDGSDFRGRTMETSNTLGRTTEAPNTGMEASNMWARTMEASNTGTEVFNTWARTVETSNTSMEAFNTKARTAEASNTSGRTMEVSNMSARSMEASDSCGRTTEMSNTTVKTAEASHTSGRTMEAIHTSGRTMEVSNTSARSMEASDSCGRTTEMSNTRVKTAEASHTSGRTMEASHTSGRTMEASNTNGRTMQASNTRGRTVEAFATPISMDNAVSNPSYNEAMDVDDIHMADEMEHTVGLTGDREIPFTYLASLSAKWASVKENTHSVQGKIKCFLTGVKGFQFKQRTEYDLRVYVDDGSLISEILIDHNVVQKGIGYSPKEVSDALASSDKKTVGDMKDIVKQFQIFLMNFEGTMLIEINEAFPLPVALEMDQGCSSSDARLLLKRLQSQASAQKSLHPNMDPITLSP